jgi:nucleoside phosphorylase
MTTTAILSALAEEQHGLIELLERPQRMERAGRTFWRGVLGGQPVVPALSRLSEHLFAAARSYLTRTGDLADPGPFTSGATLHRGLIASGDQFVGRADQSSDLKADLPPCARSRIGQTTKRMWTSPGLCRRWLANTRAVLFLS